MSVHEAPLEKIEGARDEAGRDEGRTMGERGKLRRQERCVRGERECVRQKGVGQEKERKD